MRLTSEIIENILGRRESLFSCESDCSLEQLKSLLGERDYKTVVVTIATTKVKRLEVHNLQFAPVEALDNLLSALDALYPYI